MVVNVWENNLNVIHFYLKKYSYVYEMPGNNTSERVHFWKQTLEILGT